MPAPSKNWTSIADAQVAADSPLDVTLMTEIRDNLVFLKEWLGLNYTAAQNHTHDGVNSAPVTLASGTVTKALLAYEAGDIVLASAPTERQQPGSTGLTKRKEIVVRSKGTLRVKFDYLGSSSASYGYMYIYRNGVQIAGPLGANNLSYLTSTSDLTGWNPGDLCQLYCDTSGTSNPLYVKNFQVCNLGETVNLD